MSTKSATLKRAKESQAKRNAEMRKANWVPLSMWVHRDDKAKAEKAARKYKRLYSELL